MDEIVTFVVGHAREKSYFSNSSRLSFYRTLLPKAI